MKIGVGSGMGVSADVGVEIGVKIRVGTGVKIRVGIGSGIGSEIGAKTGVKIRMEIGVAIGINDAQRETRIRVTDIGIVWRSITQSMERSNARGLDKLCARPVANVTRKS